jgi:hypothetical protein
MEGRKKIGIKDDSYNYLGIWAMGHEREILSYKVIFSKIIIQLDSLHLLYYFYLRMEGGSGTLKIKLKLQLNCSPIPFPRKDLFYMQ